MGFELIDDRRSLLIERLRNAVIELAHYHDDGMRTNLSDYLSEKFHSDYSALSKLFSEMTGITLEKYYIAQRVERVKELLVYNELSLGQIADQTQLFEHGAPERPVQKRHGHNAQRIPEAERPGNAGRSTRYRGAGDVSCREDARGASRHPRPRKASEDISPHIPGSLREHGRGTDGGGQGRSKGNTTATSPTQGQRGQHRGNECNARATSATRTGQGAGYPGCRSQSARRKIFPNHVNHIHNFITAEAG